MLNNRILVNEHTLTDLDHPPPKVGLKSKEVITTFHQNTRENNFCDFGTHFSALEHSRGLKDYKTVSG